MKILLISLIILLFSNISFADSCQKKKHQMMNDLETQLISKLKSINPKIWKFSSIGNLYFIKTVVKKSLPVTIYISIGKFGSLHIDNIPISLSDKCHRRIGKLYKKILCLKGTPDYLLMKKVLDNI